MSDHSDSDGNKSPPVKNKNIRNVKRKDNPSKNTKSEKRIELSASEIARLLVNAVNSGKKF